MSPGTPPPSASPPQGLDSWSRANIIAAVVSSATAVGALTLTIAALRPAAVMPWALGVLAVLAFVGLISAVPATIRKAATATVAVVLVLATAAMWFAPDRVVDAKVAIVSSPTPTPVPSPFYSPSPAPAPVAVTMVYPTNGDGVPWCFIAKFGAAPPLGWAFAVAGAAAPDDTRLYFEGTVVRGEGGLWTSQTSLGDPDEKGRRPYQLHVVMMPTVWRDYLAGTRPEEGDTWWSSKDLPPDAVDLLAIDVHHDDAIKSSCH